MDWRHKLTITEKKHLRTTKTRTKQDLLDNLEYQKKHDMKCHYCLEIAQKLNLN